MRIRLGNITSDIFITIYILVTLFGRVHIEPYLGGNFFFSLFLGVAALLILWGLVHIKFLNPSWFGLYNKSKK